MRPAAAGPSSRRGVPRIVPLTPPEALPAGAVPAHPDGEWCPVGGAHRPRAV